MRVTSLNYEIHIDGKVIYPQSIGEFANQGEEGRVEVADGSFKYKIRDGIKVFDEIELIMPVKKSENTQLDILNAWVKDASTKDINVIGKDAAQNVVENWLLEDCELSAGKKSAFDRKSKAETTRRFYILPREITPA